jgi:hypothetical protein
MTSTAASQSKNFSFPVSSRHGISFTMSAVTSFLTITFTLLRRLWYQLPFLIKRLDDFSPEPNTLVRKQLKPFPGPEPVDLAENCEELLADWFIAAFPHLCLQFEVIFVFPWRSFTIS